MLHIFINWYKIYARNKKGVPPLFFGKAAANAVRSFFRYMPLRRRVLFYSVRADDKLLDNAKSVYNAFDGKKQIFAKKLPHADAVKLRQYYLLLTSKVIVTDDYIRYLRTVRLRTRQKLVQIWHAGGHMKKFGLDAPSPLTDSEERATHSQYDAVIVSSESSRAAFASAMGVNVSKILPLGLPRTDAFLSGEKRNNAREAFFEKHPKLSGKKIYLYCPTFREENAVKIDFEPPIDWDLLDGSLGGGEAFVIHRHPMMKNPFYKDEYERIHDLSNEPMNLLLCAADVIITDYSSVVLDALLLDIPPVFFCPDLHSYERDFYFDFPNELPGETLTGSETLLEAVRRAAESPLTEKMKNFRREHMGSCDGKSTQRVVSLIKGYVCRK
jgi:CDP-ribitol ribitolphosphotransferase